MFSAFDLAGGEPCEMFPDEVAALKRLCAGLPPYPNIIQVGAGPGCSTLAMLEAHPAVFILSIDTHERPVERENIERAGLDSRRVVRALGRSQDIGAYWAWPCDMLYIDGEHTRPSIDDDIRLWTPNVKPGGVIAFHDCILPGDRAPHIKSRVYEAIEDWLKSEPHREILWTKRLRAFIK